MTPPRPEDLLRTETPDGWSLQLERRQATPRPRGAVLMLHAMMADRRSLDHPRGEGLASFLATQGWEVFLADFRGHGGSGDGAHLGASWTYDDLVRQDLPTLMHAIHAVSPDRPLWILGHSLGGHVAVASVGCGLCPTPAGLVLLSTNIWLPQLEPSWLRRQRKRTATGVLLHGSRLTGRAPARALRFGSCDEPLPYVEDLARFWRQARWESRDGSLDYLGAMKTIPVPMLSILGSGDTLMAHPVAARAWMEVHGPEHTQTWVVGRSEAVPFEPDHMGLVTDLRARPIWEKLSRWMQQVSAPKPQ